MAKILIKNGPPELDVIYAYFRQDARPLPEVEMTLNEEGDGMSNVFYVRLDVMIPWISSGMRLSFYINFRSTRVTPILSFLGGSGEIRTLDTFRYATFPRWWNKPLSDASFSLLFITHPRCYMKKKKSGDRSPRPDRRL